MESDELIAEEVTDIFITGGTSSIPYFRNIIEEYFKENSNQEDLFELNDDKDKDERIYHSVAYGAAIFNELISSDNNVIIKDKIPFMIYTKNEDGKKLTPINKNDTFKDYCSRLDKLTEGMKKEKKINVYQTIFGEEEKEAFVGFIPLEDEILEMSISILYRLTIDSSENVIAEIGYIDKEGDYEEWEDRFCVDWKSSLKINV